MIISTATPTPSAAGTNRDNLKLQADTLRRLFSLDLPLALTLAPLVYGASR
jgi:hypothetical protein